MFKYIILCLFVSVVLCHLNKEEGAECEWEGLKGKCVKETRCLTTLDDASPKHPVCSVKDGESIICCTDCSLVSDTRNAVIIPTTKIVWKDGRKARDNCLQYLKDLPYDCKADEFRPWIRRELKEGKTCYDFTPWAFVRVLKVRKPSAQYPHQVMLGYGADLQSAEWSAGGFIISDKYIVTAAHAVQLTGKDVKFLAMAVNNRSDPPETWQINKVKRFIAHPEYKPPAKYNDIGLIETETPIKFNKDVLPACLHVGDEDNVEEAVTTTWLSLEKDAKRDVKADTIQTIKLEAFSEEECKAAFTPSRLLRNGYDHTTQMCYGSKTNKTNPDETCKGLSGEPLLIQQTEIPRCEYIAIGVTSFGPSCKSKKSKDVYTRVEHYVPWIESIVWP